MTSRGELEAAAEAVREDLGLDAILNAVGVAHLVGSAALGLMVWPDLDMTVVCDRLDVAELHAAAGALVRHPRVRQLTIRNDSGRWNTAPDRYPDGVYWGVDYRDEKRRWNLDIWFVTDGERQPDLRHVREIGPRLTDETRQAILAIKQAWWQRPEYGRTVTSWDIYRAVLEEGIRTPQEFELRTMRTPPGSGY
ncbi:MAG TPA: hypothetical protein VF855_06195 [Acidimicrobiales bacterium]